MSSAPLDEHPDVDRDKTLTEKQDKVRKVLWHCVKDPPQVENRIGPGELRFAAKFSIGSAGVKFEDVKTGPHEIVVVAHLDPQTAEVNMEQLTALAGLDSVDEAVSIWESIKELVASTPSPPESEDDESEKTAAASLKTQAVSHRPYHPDAAAQVEDANAAIAEITSMSKTKKRTAGDRTEDDRLGGYEKKNVFAEFEPEVANKSGAKRSKGKVVIAQKMRDSRANRRR